jgi:hypothetical protein
VTGTYGISVFNSYFKYFSYISVDSDRTISYVTFLIALLLLRF